MLFKQCLAATLIGALLAACGSAEKEEPALTDSSTGPSTDAALNGGASEKPVTELYQDAWDKQQKGNYASAATAFEEVERLYPYSPWAREAQLMQAWSLYQSNRYAEAEVALDRFINLHPGHEYTPYAYYLKALSYYEQITDVGRDQDITQQALKALDQVIRRYPNTKYARDAQLKKDLTRDHLAGKEMEVGRFYLNRRQYLAAVGRFKKVVQEYETTTHTAEALHRMVESYLALGLPEEARRNAAVLGHNYPGSKWYQESYGLVGE